MIKVNQLNKYFNRRKKNEIHVLNNVSVEFPEKGLVVLLGPSGSGKTTLLNVLGGLDKVQSGSIDFDGNNIMGYDVGTWDKIRNEYVGYIFQNYNLLPELSVYDNIAFVLKMMGIKDPEIIDKRVLYILNAVHMYPFRKKKALQLSGGQQQRVAIARALVKNPKVIIADEPTGNLDSKNTMDIMNVIKQISSEKLVVLVTHERHIAEFYGDRIIEVKDGQIISDELNTSSDDHHIAKDDTIYLKDYKHIADESQHGINLGLYADHEDDLKDVDIKLIVKNKTLYLDVKSPFKKMKFVDEHAGVVIKDEHYVKKTKEELIETTFDSDMLDNKYVDRQSSLMVSVKQSLWLAFQKVLKTSKKGKLMLFSFLVAGMVIAVTVSMLASVAVLQPEQYMSMPEGYVSVQRSSTSTEFVQSEILTFKEADDDSFYINTLGQAQFQFVQPNGSLSSVNFSGQIELSEHVVKRDLEFGRLPVADDEILVSKAIADGIVEGSIFGGAQGQEIGIWSYDHLTKEIVLVDDKPIKIVGIVESDLSLIYMSENLANLYYSSKNSLNILPFSYFDDALVSGAQPEDDQILVSESYYNGLFGNNDYTAGFPKTIPGLEIAGVYGNQVGYGIVMKNSLFNQYRIQSDQTFNLYIYTDNRVAVALEIDEETQYNVADIYQEALTDAKEMRADVIVPTLSTSGILIGFAMVGFYFVIRSSLISRIYEVSVYRALGVKKNDIFVSFIVEIFVLTSISTLLGYIIASFALTKLSNGLIGEFNFFLVNPLTFILGLIVAYIINMLAGILPVFLLLRKTPAQILAQYDI
ncbi:MAG: ABC transporter ATP-binding protein/permease [Acholeplasmataceae bacterium]|nr:ABC transporter ATP-binding protein/permease [Acholeplasmataceae bacterium]